jgi:molecular chaperone GrpE
LSGQVPDAMPSWWSRFFNGSAQSDMARRLERMEQQLADLGRQVEALRASAEQNTAGAGLDLPSLHEALLGLEKQVGRAGREQLKANSIADAQSAQLAAALEQLRAADTRREAELDALREQRRADLAAARLAAAQDILPALDGLDEALRAGRLLLATADHREGEHVPGAESGARAIAKPAPGGWLRQLLGRQPTPAEAGLDAATRQLAEQWAAIDSWVMGLTFVRQRLLDALATAGVRPIIAAGRAFDPRQHIAIGVVQATEDRPAGTVVEELRRGYLAGERVLRHAEVVVAASEEQRLEDRYEGALA